jgi:glutathione S-transferase
MLPIECQGERRAATVLQRATPNRSREMIRLYSIAASGNCYRVRLFLALLGLRYELTEVEETEAGLIAPGLSDVNPLGEVPALVDHDVKLRDSQAILVYLATAYATKWLPQGAAELARVVQWLSFAANEIQNGPRMLRAMKLGIITGGLEEAERSTARVFVHLDNHLCSREWLESGIPTIADIACYPYIWNASEGGVEMADYPAVGHWLRRIKNLPGYEPMLMQRTARYVPLSPA